MVKGAQHAATFPSSSADAQIRVQIVSPSVSQPCTRSFGSCFVGHSRPDPTCLGSEGAARPGQ